MSAAYPDEVRARALELLAVGTSIAATRRALTDQFGTSPAGSTLKRWATEAGVDRSVQPRKGGATPAEAQAARLERLAIEREDLSEMLLSKLSRGTADLLARRISRALEAEELVDIAAQRWADCLKLERMAIEEQMGTEAVRDAKRATAAASDDLAVAHRLAIGTRDLVGILTRAVTDHLAIEGIGADERDTGEIIVELLVPEPTRPDEVATAAEVADQ
jgi:hypothetical protein